MMTKPTNWQSGWTGDLRLPSGEEPFLINGQWYLYVWDTAIKDHRVYEFATDMLWDYSDFQNMITSTTAER
jgi:hypothetical protein